MTFSHLDSEQRPTMVDVSEKLPTKRTAVVDLTKAHPSYVQGPDLPEPTRYLNSVLMPDDTVFTTGGSKDYRGRSSSDILRAQIYSPATSASASTCSV